MSSPTSVIPHTLPLDDARAQQRAAVGGKAMSLARLIAGGFPVPPGFVVSTASYLHFVEANGLAPLIADAVERLDYGDPAGVETLMATIRGAVNAAPLPTAVEDAIVGDYRRLGEPYVAVRSSGTAEDLAEASFAGLHDTYLDVQGAAAVLAAVRACWASLWTARCVAYRHDGGFDHASAQIAVVVQTMVDATSAGVLFTANPLTVRTDQFVVNAAWGLGEGVVSGILTPDEFIVDRATHRILQTTIGAKELRVVRNPDTGVGTVHQQVPANDTERASISDGEVTRLAELGSRVMAYYEGIPQDLEWAVAGGELYLLQSRDITGVPFTWDEDVDGWQTVPERADTVWSHAFADEFWTGGITPLFYSVRAREVSNIDQHDFELWGFHDLMEYRSLKWYRGTAYYNSNLDRLYDQYLFPPSLRGSTLWKIPPAWRDEATAAPFDFEKAVATHLRIDSLAPDRNLLRWFEEVYDYVENEVAAADGPSPDELRAMTDDELRASTWKTLDLAEHFIGLLRPAFHFYGVGVMGLLNQMVSRWYDGDNNFIFQELVSGLPRPTKTTEEARAIWRVAAAIRASETLSATFAEQRGTAFFSALETTEEGREFLRTYRDELLVPHGHRGHADRDIWYPRRNEDASLDYESLRAFVLVGDGPTHEEHEHRLIQQREGATEEVLASIRRLPLGSVKAKAFELLHEYVLTFLLLRDDERHYIDRVTFAKKRHFQELGRRLVERGLLDGDDDFYFLAHHELEEVWATTASARLVRAKIAGRRALFERHLARLEHVAPYVQNGQPVHFETEAAQHGEGVLRGMGTSRGTVTGTARVVPDLAQVGRVQKGDILVCNSTDPGWAAVFTIISGLVLETGGMLAHGSCLSREYNLPAVTLRNAMTLIEDGATITVSGDAGEVYTDGASGPA